MNAIFICKSQFSCSVETLFDFHESSSGFETLVTGAKGVKVLQKPGSIQKGEIAIFKITLFPGISVIWEAHHTDYEKNKFFEDTQKKGPFRFFRHRHLFFPKENESILEDRIEFDFPVLALSKYPIQLQLRAQFLERHKLTANFLKGKWTNLHCGLSEQ
ncbi:MAG: SRPBCC family protein [Leptospiraceae bacterium]|nr:SRPBCC family protein [Leptospiraceae bacterium]MCP5512242.1 SRPBCC family protein [Leptospiraceae bacterium]